MTLDFSRPQVPSFGRSPFGNPVDQGELDRRVIETIARETIPLKMRRYDPVWTATTTDPAIGNGTLNGYYVVMGDLCWFHIRMQAGSTTTFGSGLWQFSLPVASSVAVAVSVQARDNTASQEYGGTGRTDSTPNVVAMAVNTASADGRINSTHPFTWATDDNLWITGTILRDT